jgi:membrane-associated HD superfamily phosphohydrolase
VITDIIKEHHGTGLVKFFYYKQNQAYEQNPQLSKPDEQDFRYKSVPPSTKESAIVMLADTVEAAVRSSISKGMTVDEVSGFIDTLIKDKLNDGQLNDCGLTIKDLDKAKKAFLEIFKGMYHERVAYPNQNNKE